MSTIPPLWLLFSKNYNTNITKNFETSKYFYYFLQFFFCAYSWIRTNALPYPYGRFLCLSGLTDSISNISRHYFDSSVVSCSVYASNLYRQIGNADSTSSYIFTLIWVRSIEIYIHSTPIIKLQRRNKFYYERLFSSAAL